MHDRRDSLGISTIVLSGESGGGNLTSPPAQGETGRQARPDRRRVRAVSLSGLYATQPPELPSMTENDEYFLACRMMGAMAAVYTGGEPSTDRSPGLPRGCQRTEVCHRT